MRRIYHNLFLLFQSIEYISQMREFNIYDNNECSFFHRVCLKVIAEIDPDEKEKCFLFPRLGMNVFDFIVNALLLFLCDNLFDFCFSFCWNFQLKKNQRRPLPLAIIKAFAWQLLRALSFLHEIGITHGDLKPDNYLFFNATVSVSKPLKLICYNDSVHN